MDKQNRNNIMSITIKANDYVQPTEVRDEIVQAVCDVIMSDYMGQNRSMSVFKNVSELYIGKYKGSDGHLVISTHDTMSAYEYTRIRTCEMVVAFELIQQAGYFIFKMTDKKSNTDYYRFKKKPYYMGVKAKKVEFDTFID